MASNLPRTSCAEAKIDPAAILKMIDALEVSDIDMHSLMVVRNGAVAAEGWWKPYSAEAPHLLYSLTKSFCSTAAGFAVAEGLFSLDDPVFDYFGDLAPESTSENLKKLRVRHLLSMSVGHETEPSIDARSSDRKTAVTKFLAHPVPFEPGTHFHYNTAATNMVSILIQKQSGTTLDRFLESRLLRPLGIEGEYWTSGADWVWGGSGLHAQTEAIAKLGKLYLNLGKWEGEQLLPLGWAETATSLQVPNGTDPDNDWNQGYGFQFWRSRHGYRGDGAFGQFCLVLPEYDAVVAMTSGESNMQRMMNAVWDYLLPGFDTVGSDSEKLGLRLDNLAVEPKAKPHTGINFKAVSKPDGFELEVSGSKVRLDFGFKLEFELGRWTKFGFNYGRNEIFPSAAFAYWKGPEELVIRIVNLRTPQSRSIGVSVTAERADVKVSEKGVFDPIEAKEFAANLS